VGVRAAGHAMAKQVCKPAAASESTDGFGVGETG